MRKRGLIQCVAIFVVIWSIYILFTSFVQELTEQNDEYADVQSNLCQNKSPSVPDDIVEFMQLIDELPLLCIDKYLINCLRYDIQCRQLSERKNVRFVLIESRWNCISKVLIDKKLSTTNTSLLLPNWTIANNYVQIDSTFQRHFFISKYINSTIHDYILFPSFNDWPARAVIKFRLIYFESSFYDRKQPTFRITAPAHANFFWHWQRGRFMLCNETLANEMQEKYGTNISSTSIISDNIIDDMAQLRDILIELRMTPMLIGGTLLGWYRECGILKHTTDIDFGTPIDEYRPKLISKIQESNRFKFYWILGKMIDSLEFTVKTIDKVRIDIFFIYHNDSMSYVSGLDPSTFEKMRWEYPLIDETCATELKTRLFYIPCNFDQIIIADYGTNWSIPHLTSNYDWKKSGKNAQIIGKLEIRDFKHVVKLFNND